MPASTTPITRTPTEGRGVSFGYIRPATVGAAAELAAAGARILAGGQSLMPLVNRGDVAVSALVDINRLPELDTITFADGLVEIGALARLESVRAHPIVAERLPLLAKALDWVANPAIRRRGTLVGNLVQFGPGAEAVAVAALANARLVCAAGNDAEILPLGSSCTARFATAVRLRASARGTRAGFYEAQKRFGHLGTVGCGVTVAPDGAVAAVFSGLTDAPLVAPTLARALEAGELGDAALCEALRSDLGARPARADIHATARYRLDVAPVVARRALAAALAERPA